MRKEIINTEEPKWVTTSHFNFDFFSFSAACISYQTSLVKLLGFPFDYKYHNLDIYYNEDNFDRHEQLLFDQPHLITEQIDFLEIQSGVLIAASKKYGEKNDAESFRLWYETYLEFLPTLGIVVAPERVLSKKIKEFLSEEQFAKIAFSDETATARELRALLEIAMDVSNTSSIDPIIKNHIQEHTEKYGWLGNKWMTYAPFTEEQFTQRIIAAKDKAKEQLKNIEFNRKKLNTELNELMQTLTSEQQSLIELYRKLLYWRTGRGEAAALSCSLNLPLFTWIGNQVGLNRSQVVKYAFAELMSFIETNTKVEEPEERENFNAVMIDDVIEVDWYAQSSSQIMNETTTAPGDSETIFKGTVASKGKGNGKVTGKVRIIRDTPDLKDFQAGEILVAASTNPNMVTAMEKAIAFVTDVGGLTSHAAIISRELNVPCIIGTKIATKVLKNGDEIEVDANTGTITILKK